MKTSRTKLKSSFFFSLMVFSSFALAKPVAQVTGISGGVFTMGPDGKTKTLKLNDHLEEKSDVMVEDGASVTLNDYFDSTYSLTGGSHLKIFNQSVQLKKGKVWIQSQTARHPLALTTANAQVDFWKSEFIMTFDQMTSRSQVLVVNGDLKFSNILDSAMKLTVDAGTFSLIDPATEDGVPRAPTKVGLESLNKALADFKQLPEKLKTTTEEPSRQIASVTPAEPKKGEISFIKSNRLPASIQDAAQGYWKKSLQKKSSAASKSSISYTSAPIKFYGAAFKKLETEAKLESPRKPASIPMTMITPSKTEVLKTLSTQEFDESLKKQEVQQPEHPNDLNSLIHDLKSY
jgi:FecR protein